MEGFDRAAESGTLRRAHAHRRLSSPDRLYANISQMVRHAAGDFQKSEPLRLGFSMVHRRSKGGPAFSRQAKYGLDRFWLVTCSQPLLPGPIDTQIHRTIDGLERSVLVVQPCGKSARVAMEAVPAFLSVPSLTVVRIFVKYGNAMMAWQALFEV